MWFLDNEKHIDRICYVAVVVSSVLQLLINHKSISNNLIYDIETDHI